MFNAVLMVHDETQTAIAQAALRLLQVRSSGARLRELLQTRGAFDQDFWRICREQGWTALGIAEAFSGIGLGIAEMGLIAEACGAVVCGAPFLGTGFAAGQAISRHGSDLVKALWLPKIASGAAKGVIAFAEGADLLPQLPAATMAQGEDGRLTGVKTAVAGAAVADVAVVSTRRGDSPALALVDLHQEGVTRYAFETFDNSRCTADLSFDNVPATMLSTSDGLRAGLDILELQAVVTAHEQVGGAAATLHMARDYALQRHAFGQPVGAFQSVKHRIAEGYVLVELARANAYRAASFAGTPEFSRAAAAARLTAIEAYETVSRDAVQIHAAFGVTWEADLHLHQRRARSLALEQGPMMFWEDVLVTALMETGDA